MSDFVHTGWSLYITIVTIVSIIACLALLFINSKRRAPGAAEQTGHVWDEDLVEYNNPLPRWWISLFYITIVFGILYLALYPGLGTFAGLFGWSSQHQYQDEDAKAQVLYTPIFEKYLKQDLTQVAANLEAQKIGQRLFLTYCAQCHGSDAGGSRGFPSLRDNDWLYGGTLEKIKETIMGGRGGVMPPMGPALGEEGVNAVAQYVLSLSGSKHDVSRVEQGKQTFMTFCAACHGLDAKGGQAVGAPNLTDNIWLYSGDEKTLIETISKGRNGNMPAHKDLLGEPKVHLLAAYVYSLSHADARKSAQTQ
ncbi:MAG: cytochrome-c oxidase, cbb3-type subunit III [Burkholderiales bacterium]